MNYNKLTSIWYKIVQEGLYITNHIFNKWYKDGND